jgi:hypothetical protein
MNFKKRFINKYKSFLLSNVWHRYSNKNKKIISTTNPIIFILSFKYYKTDIIKMGNIFRGRFEEH